MAGTLNTVTNGLKKIFSAASKHKLTTGALCVGAYKFNDIKKTWNSASEWLQKFNVDIKDVAIGGVAATFGLATGGVSTAVLLGSLALAAKSAYDGDYKKAGMLAGGGFAASQLIEGNLGWTTLGIAGAVASYLSPQLMKSSPDQEQVAKINPAAEVAAPV